MSKTYYTWIKTPAGIMLGLSDGKVVTALYWKVFNRTPKVLPDWIEDEQPFQMTKQQLHEYFAGERQTFDFPYEIQIGTPFQKKVWAELEKLQFGTTSSYGKIAEVIGHPKAVRAVGTAVGSNPISIVVPCHRVLSGAGTITGYAGGVDSKRLLLTLEGVQ